MKKHNNKGRMMKKEEKEAAGLERAVVQFGRAYGKTLKNIRQMAQIYSNAVKTYREKAVARFSAAYPVFTENTWERLRMIGNGDANPGILFVSDIAATKVCRMTKNEQDEFFSGTNGIEVYNPQTRKAETIGYDQLKPRHVCMLFDKQGKCRTLAEQVAFSNKAAKSKETKNKEIPPYAIEGSFLAVRKRCRIGLNELKDIVAKMEAAP
jgi:hypothetical protein